MTTTELIHQRLRDATTPSTRTDGCTLAVAVEGGGMRGVVSAGMLLALEQLGMRSCVDMVVGTSAGALSAAFFVAERGSEGSVLFYSDLNTAPFIDRRRLLRGGPAVDLDYLIGDAARRRGLKFADINASELRLYATVAPVDPDNERRVFQVHGANAHIAAVLSATACLPVLAGRSRTVDGDDYVDGGLREQVPWRSAAGLGATHILVLPSRPVSGTTPLSSASFVERVAVNQVVRRRHGPHVADLVARLPARATQQMFALRALADGRACMLDYEGRPWNGHIELVEVPANLALPRRLESERPTLIDGLMGGAQAIVEHFGHHELVVEQRVVLTHPGGEVKKFRSGALREFITETP